MLKVLSPGMEHRQKTQPGAQMFWIGANLQQGLGRGPEQDGVKHPLVLEGQGRERLREREDDMKVFNRQQLGATLLKPCRPGRAPALRAMPIAAGAIEDLSMATVVALFDAAAEGCGAGRPRSLSALFFAERRASLQTPRGKLDRGCGKCRPAPAPGPSSSRIRFSRIGQTIQGADRRTHRQIGNVQIPGRGLQVAMPHENLDAPQDRSTLPADEWRSNVARCGAIPVWPDERRPSPACRCARQSFG